jgi:hypothetical protein
MTIKPKTTAAESGGTETFEPAAIEKVVREELDRNNKYLEFAQKQIETDRGFYKHLYTYAVAFLVFMIAVAGFFSYTSVSQMRADMKASVDAELAALRAQATAASSEAKSTVGRELANVRTEVQKRIDTEFRGENIATLVAQTAKAFTERELNKIITSEVAKGIQSQQQFISSSIDDQTKKAVQELEPRMLGIFSAELSTKLADLNAEIQKKFLDETGKLDLFVNIERFSTLARTDARNSFDQLLSIIKNSNDQDAINFAKANVDSIIGERFTRIQHLIDEAQGYGGNFGSNADSFLKRPPEYNTIVMYDVGKVRILLQGPNADHRVDALSHLARSRDIATLTLLVDTIERDESLDVLIAGVYVFSDITANLFVPDQYDKLIEWWHQNKHLFDEN